MMNFSRNRKILLFSFIFLCFCLPLLLSADDALKLTSVQRYAKEIRARFDQLRNQVEMLVQNKNLDLVKRVPDLKILKSQSTAQSSIPKTELENETQFVFSEDFVNWMLELGRRVQPRLKNYVNNVFRYALLYLDKFKTQTIISNWIQYLEAPAIITAIALKFIDGVLIRSFTPGTLPERGREVITEIVDESPEDFISDQEPPVRGEKPYRLQHRIKSYRKESSVPGNRAEFGYTKYTVEDESFKYRQPKYEEDYRSPKEVNSKPKGNGKNLKLTKQTGESGSAVSSQYMSKMQHQFTAKVYSFAHALDPFAVLAVLAFLTFLALLIQQLLRAFGVLPVVPGRETNLRRRTNMPEIDTFYQQWILSTLEKLNEAFSDRLDSLASERRWRQPSHGLRNKWELTSKQTRK